MDVTANLAAIGLLLAANGFFVAAEFALVKARGFRIATLAGEGSAAARLSMRIQGDLEAYLAACRLGITMATLGLGWMGEPAVATLFEPLFRALGVPDAVLHTSAFIVGFLIFSSLHIVIGEQVPKTFAIRRPEPVSLWVAYPLHFAYLAFLPLNWLLGRISCGVLNLLGVEEIVGKIRGQTDGTQAVEQVAADRWETGGPVSQGEIERSVRPDTDEQGQDPS